MENHRLTFFSQKVGFIIESAAPDPIWWIKCIQKKPDGTWEKPSLHEGQNVKMSLLELAAIVNALQSDTGWSTVHKFNENSTSFKLQPANDGRFALYLTIGIYNKGFASNETLLLRLFLEHILAEKIATATVSQAQAVDESPPEVVEEPEESQAPAAPAKKTTAPAKKATAPAKKTTAPAKSAGDAPVVPISTLTAAPVSGTIQGRVMSVEALRSVNTRNGPSKVLSLVIADDTDQIRVSVWGAEAEANQNVEQGSLIRLTNVLSKLSTYSNSYEAGTGRGSTITLVEGPGDAPDLPEDIEPPFPAEGAPPAAAVTEAAPVPAPLPEPAAPVLPDLAAPVRVEPPAAPVLPDLVAPVRVEPPAAPVLTEEHVASVLAERPAAPALPDLANPVRVEPPAAPVLAERPAAPPPGDYRTISGKILAESVRAIRIGQGEPDPVTHKYPVDQWIPRSAIAPGSDPLVPETLVKIGVTEYVVKKNHIRVD